MNTLDFILNKYKKERAPLIELYCSRLRTFPRLFSELGFKVGAEIGVARGYFSQRICQKTDIKMYAIDAWKLWPGATHGETQKKMDRLYRDAVERLTPLNCEIIRDWSMNAVQRFEDESLDFVYIDAGHDYDSVTEDIREWSKKVRTGGIVAGHDYIEPEAFTFGDFNHFNYDVKRAVDDFVIMNSISSLFVFTKDYPNDKATDEKKGFAPSWFYVK